jgi:peptide methionine sulfoxide reductase MsrA
MHCSPVEVQQHFGDFGGTYASIIRVKEAKQVVSKEEAKQLVNKKEVARKVSSETLVNFYHATWHYITEDNTLHY